MKIIDNGVLLGADEIIQFFDDNHETNSIVLYQGEREIGDIIAITNDDRFVLDVDGFHDSGIGAGGIELFSAKFKEVTVTRTGTDASTLEIRII